MATQVKHRHRDGKQSRDYGFTACHAGWDCNPAAHGNVSYWIYCAEEGCGAVKHVNVNGRYSEESKWMPS